MIVFESALSDGEIPYRCLGHGCGALVLGRDLDRHKAWHEGALKDAA